MNFVDFTPTERLRSSSLCNLSLVRTNQVDPMRSSVIEARWTRRSFPHSNPRKQSRPRRVFTKRQVSKRVSSPRRYAWMTRHRGGYARMYSHGPWSGPAGSKRRRCVERRSRPRTVFTFQTPTPPKSATKLRPTVTNVFRHGMNVIAVLTVGDSTAPGPISEFIHLSFWNVADLIAILYMYFLTTLD